ncbi:DUF2490 domain-containing protein [Tenacibaculum sp. UWU-22]|uniref:DUF2490 domain-containing protein n=1 Tax=Tenacibaculum sp. UWU-22 TaxID=3234187 RepID=UPI0034DB0B0B
MLEEFIKVNKTKIVSVFAMLWFSTIISQGNNFTTINIENSIKQSGKWGISAVVHWKQFYSADGWSRIGLDLEAKKNSNQWDLYGGFVSNNTIDKKQPDYWELRPWLGVGLTNTVYKQLQLNQLFKFEWRNFLFSEKSLNKITTRYRYKLNPFYNFKKGWQVYTSYEWYILPNKDLGTRFINAREWCLGVSKKIANYVFSLDFTEEWYNKTQSDEKNGNTLTLTISF